MNIPAQDLNTDDGAPSEVTAAWMISVVLCLCLLAHVSYFAVYVPYLEVETLPFSRAFSCACAVVSFILLNRIVSAWSGDAIIGAALPLGLLLFPSSAFIYALAVPTVLLTALFFAGVWVATIVWKAHAVTAALVLGGLVVSLPFLQVSGAYLSLALIGLVVIERPPSRFFLYFSGSAAICGIALGLFFPFTGSDAFWMGEVVMMSRLIEEAVRPYAMLWLGLAFSLSAWMGSPRLRDRISTALACRLLVITVAFFCAALFFVFQRAESDIALSMAVTALLPLGLLLALPMVMWMRFVMPQLKSIWVWILLPVVMYSCFWVVLGPIDFAAFPYDQVPAGQ